MLHLALHSGQLANQSRIVLFNDNHIAATRIVSGMVIGEYSIARIPPGRSPQSTTQGGGWKVGAQLEHRGVRFFSGKHMGFKISNKDFSSRFQRFWDFEISRKISLKISKFHLELRFEISLYAMLSHYGQLHPLFASSMSELTYLHCALAENIQVWRFFFILLRFVNVHTV